MASDTDIVNVALGMLGATRITSLTDGSNNANKANDIYAEKRDYLLRSHPWNFATKRQQLSQSSTSPAFEFDYAYALPNDWLRTVSVHDNDAGHGTVLYRMEIINGQRAIVTSSSSIYLRYIYQVTSPNLMTVDFRTTLASLLARELAIPLTSSSALRKEMANQFRADLAQARSTDGLGAFPELRPRGSWANSRGGYNRDDFLSD